MSIWRSVFTIEDAYADVGYSFAEAKRNGFIDLAESSFMDGLRFVVIADDGEGTEVVLDRGHIVEFHAALGRWLSE